MGLRAPATAEERVSGFLIFTVVTMRGRKRGG
jgi:hypothetical protein